MSWQRVYTFIGDVVDIAVTMSGMIAFGLSVAALFYWPDARWMQPLIIAMMSVVTQFAHTTGQRRHVESVDAERRRHDDALALAAREHAESMAKVAMGHDESLKRLEAQIASGALRFSLRVEASAAFLQATFSLINNAAGIIRALDTADGTPNRLPSVWFHEASGEAVTTLHANAERPSLNA